MLKNIITLHRAEVRRQKKKGFLRLLGLTVEVI
jgi:hypothetical protein